MSLESLRKSIEEILEAINYETEGALAEANCAIEEINSQLKVLDTAATNLYEITDISEGFCEAFSCAAEMSNRYATKAGEILDSICEADIPTHNLETYLGNCEICGAEVHSDDEAYGIDEANGAILCEDCFAEDNDSTNE